MTLEHTQHKHGSTSERLTECPIDGCDKTFKKHSGGARRQHLLDDHNPEDFGL